MTMEEGKSSLKQNLIAGFLAMEPVTYLVDIAKKLGGGSISEEVQYIIQTECINNKIELSLQHQPRCASLNFFCEKGQANILRRQLLICRNYQPSPLYVKNFLKKVILATESECIEVLDALYQCYTHYMMHCKENGIIETIGKCYKSLTFIFPSKSPEDLPWCWGKYENEGNTVTLTLRSSLNMLEGGTGCSIWPSSLFLSEFILSHPQLFSGKCCFEVGSGVGLVGICLNYVMASKVILTDGDMLTLSNMKHNLEANSITVMAEKNEATKAFPLVESKCLLWETASTDELQSYDAEIILGADVIYDPSAVPHLVRVLEVLLRDKSPKERTCQKRSTSKQTNYSDNDLPDVRRIEDGYNNEDIGTVHHTQHPVAYIAVVIRNIDTFNCFLDLTAKNGLDVTDITKEQQHVNLLPYLSSFDRSMLRLYRIYSKAC